MNIDNLRGRKVGIAIHLGFIYPAVNGYVGEQEDFSRDTSTMTLIHSHEELRVYVHKLADAFVDAVITRTSPPAT